MARTRLLKANLEQASQFFFFFCFFFSLTGKAQDRKCAKLR